MIKQQGIDKLQHCFENSSWKVLQNDIEINTFSIDIEIYEEISIYDPFTSSKKGVTR